MNDLYEAVMILGRSVEDIDSYGWSCGTLGHAKDAPKCVNGVLSVAAGGALPAYIGGWEITPVRVPMRMAAIALIKTTPPEIMAHTVEQLASYEDGDDFDAAQRFIAGLEAPDLVPDLDLLGRVLAVINDQQEWDDDEWNELPMLTRKSAREWFSRALDKLAERLPEPIPAERPLTVQEIIGTPSELTIGLA